MQQVYANAVNAMNVFIQNHWHVVICLHTKLIQIYFSYIVWMVKYYIKIMWIKYFTLWARLIDVYDLSVCCIILKQNTFSIRKDMYCNHGNIPYLLYLIVTQITIFTKWGRCDQIIHEHNPFRNIKYDLHIPPTSDIVV